MEKLESLLSFIIKGLVEKQDEVVIKYEIIDTKIKFKVSVAEGEMGRVIGKNGMTANSIRGLMQAAGIKDKLFVTVDFVD